MRHPVCAAAAVAVTFPITVLTFGLLLVDRWRRWVADNDQLSPIERDRIEVWMDAENERRYRAWAATIVD